MKKLITDIKKLKEIDDIFDVFSSLIPIKNHNGFLLPISRSLAKSDHIIHLLSLWRQNADTFHNKFPVTFDRTKLWLEKNLMNIDNKILFLVLSNNFKTIGHTGFSNITIESLEIDNVVRGVDDFPGIMAQALLETMSWANINYGYNRFVLKTLANNFHAISFYKKLGFKKIDEIPLKFLEKADGFDHEVIEDNSTPDNFFYVFSKGI